MATIYNSDLSKEIQQGAKIQQNYDTIPNELAEKVLPVMEVNPKLLRRANVVKYVSGASSGTIYTTPTDKDFFLCTAILSVNKDVASTAAGTYLSCVVEGVTTRLIHIAGITLTVQSECLSVSFPVPIKIDRNTPIAIASSASGAVIAVAGTITGYTVED